MPYAAEPMAPTREEARWGVLPRAARLPVVAAAATALLLVGCSGDAPEAPEDGLPPMMTLTAAPEPSVTPSPDPTATGSLDDTSLPTSWLGFEAAIVTPEEGEFVPNGSWLHAQHPERVMQDALPPCVGVAASEFPSPSAALTGTYLNPDGQHGDGIALEFESAEAAAAWFDSYASSVEACPEAPDAPETMDYISQWQREGNVVADNRMYDLPWSARTELSDTKVTQLVVQGTFPMATLLADP
ncbi:MAG: hypothetical protein Q4D79_09200 [Propionibacteriaceae bacterium]|nr:hypothetical protein [Propionibacteriaceae bacterium]